MSIIVLHFLHGTSVLSGYIDVVLTLSILLILANMSFIYGMYVTEDDIP